MLAVPTYLNIVNLVFLLQVDEEALRRQIEECKAREEEKQRLDEAFEKQRLRDAELAMMLEKRTEEVNYP
ncbi:hypothetical protein PR048_031631 [Dryococelus australis]|uniref:Uncharacterized protein n=1 Tax=Dryococelus australis TaxID=614101 RepID=A0ABQ9G9V2_9NEOP|nr:hypothetical protein PR048_031631 [Dryococelus australis]